MSQFVVRSIEVPVIAGLKVKARLAGVPFEAFVRDTLRAAAPLSGREKVSLIEEFKRQYGPIGPATPPEDILRDEREGR